MTKVQMRDPDGNLVDVSPDVQRILDTQQFSAEAWIAQEEKNFVEKWCREHSDHPDTRKYLADHPGFSL